MDIVNLIHQARALNLRIQVVEMNRVRQIRIAGNRTTETSPIIAELIKRQAEVLISYDLWQRLQELLRKENLWLEESRELLHLADRFGLPVDIQRTLLGSIYDPDYGRMMKVSRVSNSETFHKLQESTEMAKVSDIYQSAWLKAEDLLGKAPKVTIESATTQEFKNQDGTKERKIVLSFVGKAKKLILNKGQAGTLVKLYGDETDAWAMREVVLSPLPTNNGKETIAITGVPVAEHEQSPF